MFPAEILTSPIKGKADWRDFRCLQLDNGVTLCLVHDKESTTTAAAATVTVGAAADPREMSGLAHFCEHMCFLGSIKYPGENEYKSYLAQHGGRSNASTSMHLTTYKFEILADYAEHALSVFSSFFTEPLFTASGTGREVNAVDSENSKNLTADGRRRLQILKALGDPSHYYTKFSTGNASTLPTDTPEQLARVREALLAFHRKHYRPENLTVVVAGPQSLEKLQDWVVPLFQCMQTQPYPSDSHGTFSEAEMLVNDASNDAPPYEQNAPVPPFVSAFRPDLQGDWPVLVSIKPVSSMRKLVVMFPLPPVLKVPDQSPASVLSHLLGHEGPKSPFAVLQNEGLINSLSAGLRVAAPDFTLFQIDMSLTPVGEQRWKDVVGVIFQYCRIIAAASAGDGVELRRIWGESAALGAMFFDQTSPGGVYGLAPSLSNSIVLYGTEHSLAAGSMVSESSNTFPSQQVEDFANRLLPTNCIIERCSEAAWEETVRNIDNDEHGIRKMKEHWYGIDYYLSQIDQPDIDRWEGRNDAVPFVSVDQLALPRENSFIPRSLELCSDLPEEAKSGPRIDKDIDPPSLLVDDPKVGRLWHRLDDRYALPKASLTFLMRNAAVENVKINGVWQYDSHTTVHSILLNAMFAEALAQETYDAALAGLHWNLSLSSSGVKLSGSGFSDRLADLCEKVLQEFAKGKFIKSAYLLSCKDRVLRSLRTFFESRRADSHSLYYRDFFLTDRDFGMDDAIASAESATLESVLAHHKTLMKNDEVLVDCLFSGNESEENARRFFANALTLVAKAIPVANNNMWFPGPQERRLAQGSSVELHFSSKNTQEENGSVVITYQSPIPGFRGQNLSSTESLRNTAAIRLLCHILREPLFDELRTKQTLGYIVNSYYDVAVSSCPSSDQRSAGGCTVPVDFLVISVLSKKLPPPDVVQRVDTFLASFRETLASMPELQIQQYSSSLSAMLLKPIQKLGTEVSLQFSKIERYAPEILRSSSPLKTTAAAAMPWDNSKLMAGTIRSLDRQAILDAWDLLMRPASRSRIVSCVYGSTFPFDRSKLPRSMSGTTVIADSLSDIVQLRNKLSYYDNTYSPTFWTKSRSLLPRLSLTSPTSLGIVGLFGVGVLATGWTLLSRSRKATK